jgi:polyisoprenoid-binding protein YceI
MTRGRLWLGLVVLIAATSRAAFAQPARYSIDGAASRFVIHVGKTGLLGFAGHEHEVVAPVSHGSGAIARDHLEATSVELAVDAAALRVSGKGEPADDVPKVQKAMLGPECLDVQRFPSITFASSGVTAKAGATGGAAELMVRGTLTIHGQARAVTVPVHVAFGNGAVTATGTTRIRQTEFGIKPISVAGVVNVKDELVIEWQMVWRAAP